MGLTIVSLVEAVVLLFNALAILNPKYFLSECKSNQTTLTPQTLVILRTL